ncbi:MAG: heme biosynthesis HemY N-terminal domain-containing protein [Xanthobacteraceae bacterium]
MIRVLLFLVFIVAVAIGVAWLADRPGDIAITWLGYHIETSVLVGAAALVLLVAATILVWSILRGIVRAPSKISSAFTNRRTNRGYRAISRGIVAIGAGDEVAARRFANEARRLMPNEPLALLLSAQTAQLTGDGTDAEKTFRSMAERRDTKLLGLHGLFVEAQRRNDMAAARNYAEDAAKAQPGLGWAGEAVLQYRCADGDWVGALKALERNMQNGLVSKDVYKRQRAVLLTARALASEKTDRDTAIGLVLHALQLSPGLVPAAALAGRLLAEAGRPRKASRVVSAAWQANPHPDLAEVYATIKPQQSARDRLARIRNLERLHPNHPETALAMARAAIDAQEFDLARESLAPLLANPTQRVAALMAEIEDKASHNIGRSREWMARALIAPRDPAWTADGMVSETWLPASPATGRLDAFEWRIPVADLGPRGPVIEHEFGGVTVESPATPAADASVASPPAVVTPAGNDESAARRAPADAPAKPAPATTAAGPEVPIMPATEVPLSETLAPPASFPETEPEKGKAPSAPETALEAIAVKASGNPEIEAVPGAPAEPVPPSAAPSPEPAATASVEETAQEGAKKEKRRSFFG